MKGERDNGVLLTGNKKVSCGTDKPLHPLFVPSLDPEEDHGLVRSAAWVKCFGVLCAREYPRRIPHCLCSRGAGDKVTRVCD